MCNKGELRITKFIIPKRTFPQILSLRTYPVNRFILAILDSRFVFVDWEVKTIDKNVQI